MKTYARIDGGKVVEIIEPMADEEGNEIPIEDRFHPDFVASLVDVTNVTGVAPGWDYDGVTVSEPVMPQPSAAEVEAAKIKAAESAVQTMLDEAAKAQRYESILSASSYAALPAGEPFQAEGAAFALWRAKCWAKCYEVLAAVKAGTRAEPTIEELLAEMPALVLP